MCFIYSSPFASLINHSQGTHHQWRFLIWATWAMLHHGIGNLRGVRAPSIYEVHLLLSTQGGEGGFSG